ncbi:U2 snRNP complex subunit [Martiniozyma asiatica (nom. inval.)]|nr:U2 snRNP complex subunit [Martiniozyma asiatica]
MAKADKKLSKNQRRRLKAKQQPYPVEGVGNIKDKLKPSLNLDKVDVVIEDVKLDGMEQFADVFAKFIPTSEVTDIPINKKDEDKVEDNTKIEHVVEAENDNSNSEEQLDAAQILSKRQQRKLKSIPLADLKATAPNAIIIDWQDTTAPDPFFHVYLKTLHNSVPVPRHWSSKKGFLANKRGETNIYQLPPFIKATGIQEMRNHELSADETLKQKMRQRVQPKSGGLDLDYKVLHDAFFKYQMKPPLLEYSELYYEGMDGLDQLTPKQVSKLKPGVLSQQLQKALGVSGGKLPWLEQMKIAGPPPDYPSMKITNKGITFFESDHNKRGSWCVLVDDLESSEDEDDDHQDENEDEEENLEEVKGDFSNYSTAKISGKQEGDLAINSYGNNTEIIMPKKEEGTSENSRKDLYKVLQRMDGQSNSIYGSNAASYNVNDNQEAKKNSNSTNSRRIEHGKPESARKFRF